MPSDERDWRPKFSLAVGGSSFAGILAAVFLDGWFGISVSYPLLLSLAAGAGFLLGMSAGGPLFFRLQTGSAGLLTAAGIPLAVAWYTEGAVAQSGIEILLIAIAGALPGFFAFIIVVQSAIHPLFRLAFSGLLLLSFAGLVAYRSSSSFSSLPPPPRQERMRPQEPALALTPAMRANLREQFDADADDFLKKLDAINELVRASSLDEVAMRSFGTVEKLSQALKVLHQKMQKMVLSGKDSAKYIPFLDIEQKVVTFITRVHNMRELLKEDKEDSSKKLDS